MAIGDSENFIISNARRHFCHIPDLMLRIAQLSDNRRIDVLICQDVHAANLIG